MQRFARWVGVGAAAGIILALVPVVSGSIALEKPLGPLGKLERIVRPAPAKPPDLSGLDLLRLDVRPRRVLAPLKDGRVAELTLDPAVQRAASAIMKRYRVPEAGVVLMDVRTANVIAYASYVHEGEPFDVNVRAESPAASIFKMITGAALVEKAGLGPQTEQCYHGGRSRIQAQELRDDPVRDKWCATLSMAMGRSINVVFGRLAQKHLTPEDLTAAAGAFGFGAPLPFPVPNEPPKVEIPEDPLEFARASAGFWHTTLSPLAGASIAQTIANGGVALTPRIVSAVRKGEETLWQADSEPTVLRRAVRRETAHQVGRMMLETVQNGSAHKAFHDEKGRPFLPKIAVAGKTGTLTRYENERHYTWFVGYAPADAPEVAIAALVVNNPTWHIKGPQLARDVLRAYFAGASRPGVTSPL
jgi:cell division protein FtsI/penicillin-binding protein 2